ncbi:MAG: efflux RND transporter periplasmic adaptor subunit [Flavobacteriales bacterium]|nr:efflux RND transporter periplasmic adaptor subunit [Flavobacteriales bacterium]
MKNTITYLTFAALLTGCGAGSATDDLGRKKIELDSLKAAYKELGEKIKEADTWIAERDTTVKKNLPAVTTMVLQASRFEHFVEVHGNVKADKSADLFTMGGRVRRVLVSEGERVRAGQLIIDLDNDAIEKRSPPHKPVTTWRRMFLRNRARCGTRRSVVRYNSCKPKATRSKPKQVLQHCASNSA